MNLSSFFIIPRAAWIILAAAVGALGFALVMQFGFGVKPCLLCLWQRVPFVVTGLLALTALVWKPYDRRTQVILFLIAAVFVVGTGLAIFHTGVPCTAHRPMIC